MTVDFQDTDFKIFERPEYSVTLEYSEITEWKFACMRPIDISEFQGDDDPFCSARELEWSFTISNEAQILNNQNKRFRGMIREGYVFENFCENNIPSLNLTMEFIKNILIEKEGINSDSTVILPSSNTVLNNNEISLLLNTLNSPNLNSLILNSINSPNINSGGLTFQQGRQNLLNVFNQVLSGQGNRFDQILNRSFESAYGEEDLKKPTSKNTLKSFEILTADEELMRQYMKEDNNIIQEVKATIKKDLTDEELYNEVIKSWRDTQSNGIRCAMCCEVIKIGEKVVKLPCVNEKTGKPNPHYFHYVEKSKGEKCEDICVGGGIMEWLEEKNTCPCCRYEFPVEKEKSIENKNNQPQEQEESNEGEIESNEGEIGEENENNQPPGQEEPNVNEEEPEEENEEQEPNINNEMRNQTMLLRSLLGLVANNQNNPNSQNTPNIPCQCERCVAHRREQERLANMNEQERLEDQLLQEALRRSEQNENEEDNNSNIDRVFESENGEMMTEEEAITMAIKASME